MYTIEKIKTSVLDPAGLPIWEVVVRDMNGHVVHSDNCYDCDVDSMVDELQGEFSACIEPLDEYTIKMSSGGGTIRDFATLHTFQEAIDLGNSCGWKFMDENGFVWELFLED